VSNHAHRRGDERIPDEPTYRHGVVPGLLQFLKECFSPSEGRDRFPRRGNVTRRMNRAIKRGFYGQPKR
jgi:hypothetical protein